MYQSMSLPCQESRYRSIRKINQYEFKVALPAPSLYGQFDPEFSRERILKALLELGFDWVFEVSKAAEIVSDASRQIIEKGNVKKPVISSACPAVVRLVQVRFPNLIPNLLKIESPMEVAAESQSTQYRRKEILMPTKSGLFSYPHVQQKLLA